MSILQAIIMGIIQGITEFLPVSSSGHLAIFQNLFHINTDTGLLFDVMLHIGTLVAVCMVFYKDIKRLIVEFIRICYDIYRNLMLFIHNKKTQEGLRYHKIVHNNYRKFVVLIILSTIPTAIIGVAAKSLIEAANKTLLVPGIGLLITGMLLLVSDFAGSGQKIPKDISYSNGFFIGIAQGLATLPGLSRSGTTITACVLSGFDRKFAIKYSFIMSIPAILGATILEIGDVGKSSLTLPLFATYLLGTVIAGVVGYFCIKTMMAAIKNKKFRYFAYYCFVVGIVAITAHFYI
jgi:undecaprenyl-diphosphatase